MNRFTASIVFAIGVFLSLAGTAMAHSNVVSATPADGSSGPTPTAIEMTFNEEVNLVFSTLALTGPDGAEIALGAVSGTSDGKGMTAPLDAPLPAGAYSVNWTLLSPDGHKLEGSYSFTVSP